MHCWKNNSALYNCNIHIENNYNIKLIKPSLVSILRSFIYEYTDLEIDNELRSIKEFDDLKDSKFKDVYELLNNLIPLRNTNNLNSLFC